MPGPAYTATLAPLMASPQRPKLTVEERPERGSRAARRLRREGYVPGVVYGGGDGGANPFKVGARDPRAALLCGSGRAHPEGGGRQEVPGVGQEQQQPPGPGGKGPPGPPPGPP